MHIPLSVPPSSDPDRTNGAPAAAERWELYRLLADPVRPRLLALAAAEELAVGELAELLGEGQPKISRHAAALREAGLLLARKQGTWTLLRLAPGASDDPVVADAVRAGTSLCQADGTLARVDEVIAARDAETREFFALRGRPAKAGPPSELAAYLAAIAPLLPHRRLAVDAGTGDGPLLEVLAPVFEHVIALDRSDAQLELAAERARRRGLGNVELLRGEIDGPEILALCSARGGADAVFAARMLHHASAPAKAVRALASLARPPQGGDTAGGAVCILDYEPHADQGLREQQADLWLGFDPADLRRFAEAAGLTGISLRTLPPAWRGDGPDRTIAWQLLIGFRGAAFNESNPKNQRTQ
jgi:ArsR family transcriptional regulator